MNLEQIKQRIEKGRITLTFKEKISYYFIAGTMFCVFLACIYGYLNHKDGETLKVGLVSLVFSTLIFLIQYSDLRLIKIKTNNKPGVNLGKLKKMHKKNSEDLSGGGPRYFVNRMKGIFLNEEVEYYLIKECVYMAAFGSPTRISSVLYVFPFVSVFRNMKLRKEVKELLQKET